jgi:hypothetical protein
LNAPGAGVAAWRWALKHARRWTREMHNEAVKGLASYMPFVADEDLAFELRHFVSTSAFTITDRPLKVAELIEQEKAFTFTSRSTP